MLLTRHWRPNRLTDACTRNVRVKATMQMPRPHPTLERDSHLCTEDGWRWRKPGNTLDPCVHHNRRAKRKKTPAMDCVVKTQFDSGLNQRGFRHRFGEGREQGLAAALHRQAVRRVQEPWHEEHRNGHWLPANVAVSQVFILYLVCSSCCLFFTRGTNARTRNSKQ